ncbi:hypothetical protein CAEBREN_32799 [Caenorhabditis brenneri]|uniref:Serpentine receptor class gamma n=1 Tax=Caenorhabditis brenneri TaxID=135651 RepID=G0N2S5_CAEBE|nr:hypothetical protein CAEBREN_32799 [Caenorhabditis brenneri]
MTENSTTVILSGCSENYSNLYEPLKYLAQFGYLTPAALLYSRIIYVLWGKYPKIYKEHEFFVIYSMDGLLLLLLDIFITRLFVYIPQFCGGASSFFISHPIFMNIYYPLLNYLHSCQPFIQIFLTLNRMSSVVLPVDHNKLWRKYLKFIVFFIIFSPFFVIWNTIISQKVIIYYFGGFYINYQKLVPWASMSLFLMIIRSFAVLVTVVTTVITFWRMSKMKKRLRQSERTLCIACAANSMCFVVPAIFEAMKVLNEFWSRYWLAYLLQPLAWDVLNVGSPLVMIFASNQLRSHVFGVKNLSKNNQNRSNSIMVSSTNY